MTNEITWLNETRKVADLIPAKYNPRRWTEIQKKQLTQSISKFNLAMPLVVNLNNVVIGGHFRLAIALQLKKETVDVRVPHRQLTDEEEKELNLRLNQNMGEFDYEKLHEDYNIDFLKDIGFTDEQAYYVDHFKEVEYIDIELRQAGFDKEQLNKLKAHPKSYRKHTDEQLQHMIKSVQQNGIYRNVIISSDDYILDGHLLVEAANALGIEDIPILRLKVEANSEDALKVMISNNEFGKFSETDDRKLADLLREIKDKSKSGLKGTGFDEMKLANLIMVTRPESEIKDINEAAEWVGMPEFVPQKDSFKLLIHFQTPEKREEFLNTYQIEVSKKAVGVYSTWWPYEGRNDLSSVRFGKPEEQEV